MVQGVRERFKVYGKGTRVQALGFSGEGLGFRV